MCGVPFHAADHYIAKLIKAGKRVAICEQKGEVLPGKLVEREVTQILSAGTVTDPRLLDAARNHYLAAAFLHKGRLRLRVPRPDHRRVPRHRTARRRRAARRTGPRLARRIPHQRRPGAGAGVRRISTAPQPYDAHAFVFEQADSRVARAFRRPIARRLRLRRPAARGQRRGGDLSLSPTPDAPSAGARHVAGQLPAGELSWSLDAVSQAHLEIVRAAHRGRHEPAAGARPHRDPARRAADCANGCCIRCATSPRCEARQQFIADVLAAPDCLRQVRETLARSARPGTHRRPPEPGVGQRARPAGAGGVAGRRAGAQARARRACPPRRRTATASLAARSTAGCTRCRNSAARLADRPRARAARDVRRRAACSATASTRNSTNCAAPPPTAATGSPPCKNSEIERTGIKSLKIGYNSVFGYYIEVTKSNLASVPPDYQRKQTTAGGERFVTPRTQGDGKPHPRRGGTRAATRSSSFSRNCARTVLAEAAALQQTAQAHRGARRARRRWRKRRGSSTTAAPRCASRA